MVPLDGPSHALFGDLSCQAPGHRRSVGALVNVRARVLELQQMKSMRVALFLVRRFALKSV